MKFRSHRLFVLSFWEKSGDGINFAEGCLVTKAIDCTLQPTYWINTDGSGDPTELVSTQFIGSSSGP